LLYLAIIGAGATFVGSNPAFKVDEVRNLLQKSGTSYVLVQECESRVVREAAKAEGLPASNIVQLEDFLASASPEIQERQDGSPKVWHTFDDVEEARRTPAVLLMTSGTTGPPKLAIMSHFAILSQAAMAEWTYGDNSAQVRLSREVESMTEFLGSKTHLAANVPFIRASIPSPNFQKRPHHIRDA
jgi:acyl-coenzyme A synthetase/AMP-(fatty) acid ligase